MAHEFIREGDKKPPAKSDSRSTLTLEIKGDAIGLKKKLLRVVSADVAEADRRLS